jgi:cell division protein FtsB/cell division protein DivIC
MALNRKGAVTAGRSADDMNREKRNEKIINMEKAREKRRERRALQKSAKGPAPRHKTGIFAYRKFYVAISLVLFIMAGVYAARIMALKTNEARVTTEFEAAMDKKARLESELQYIDDPVYIEQQARTRLRMVKPGEIYYVLPGRDGETDAGAAEDEASAE